MRRRFKQVARAAVVSLAATVGLVVLPLAAEAVTLPPLNFTATSLAPDLTYAQHLVGQSDGGVTVGSCGAGGNNDGFQQYSKTGTLTQSADAITGNRLLTVCDVSAVGADGTVYAVAYIGSTEALVARKAGSELWTYTTPCSSISDVKLGTDGNVYMLASGGGCSSPKLLGVEPELATGQTTPTVVTDTDIPRSLPYRGGLSPYSGGIIVRYMDGVGFFTYAGTQQQEYTVPAGYYDGGPFATMNGWAILPLLDQAPRPFDCQDDTDAAEFIATYSVSGVVWSHQLAHCTRVEAVRPMPDGGAVARVQLLGQLGARTSHFIGIAPETNQQPRWTSGEQQRLGEWVDSTVLNGTAFVTDLNGNLVVQTQLKRYDNGDTFPNSRSPSPVATPA